MRKGTLLRRALACAVCAVCVMTAATGSDRLSSAPVTASAARQSELELAQQKLKELREKQSELDQKINSTDSSLAAEQEKQNNIKEQIELIESTVAELDRSMSLLRESIDSLNKDISEISDETVRKRREIEQEVNRFKHRLRAMYIAGGDKYTELILGADDFFDMLMKMELVKRVAGHDAAVLNALIDKKNEYEAQQAELEDKRNTASEQLTRLEEQKSLRVEQIEKLNSLYSQSSEMIAQLEKDKETFTKDQEQNTKRQDDFEASLSKLLSEQEAAAKAQNGNTSQNPSDTPAKSDPPVQNEKPRENGQPDFAWPCPGHYYISYGVGWRWGSFHKGIDIISSNIRGADICAAADGRVIFVENLCEHDYGKNSNCCRSGYGRYCIVDHGNGWTTLYGHSSNITVSVGQQVKKGQKLGIVGSTGYSTAPHLHFEIRCGTEIMDPQKLL